eukprot:scaffold4473_cov421-Prasinococcus_capsulatus_cf.AAC.6
MGRLLGRKLGGHPVEGCSPFVTTIVALWRQPVRWRAERVPHLALHPPSALAATGRAAFSVCPGEGSSVYCARLSVWERTGRPGSSENSLPIPAPKTWGSWTCSISGDVANHGQTDREPVSVEEPAARVRQARATCQCTSLAASTDRARLASPDRTIRAWTMPLWP